MKLQFSDDESAQTGTLSRGRDTGEMIRVGVVVEGRVQGVFYRQSCQREAVANRVAGWVRNAANGSVEAELEGDELAVSRVLAWMRIGPPQALVTRVVTSEKTPTGQQGFTAR